MKNKKLMKKETIEKFGNEYFLLGKKDGKKYYLENFSWNCGWYWGLGYVETFNRLKTDIESHQHFDGLFLGNQQNEKGDRIYHINDFFDESVLNDKDAWELSDLFKSCYTLRETAEIFARGKSNYSAVNDKANFKDEKLVEKINNEIMPKLFERIRELLD